MGRTPSIIPPPTISISLQPESLGESFSRLVDIVRATGNTIALMLTRIRSASRNWGKRGLYSPSARRSERSSAVLNFYRMETMIYCLSQTRSGLPFPSIQEAAFQLMENRLLLPRTRESLQE